MSLNSIAFFIVLIFFAFAESKDSHFMKDTLNSVLTQVLTTTKQNKNDSPISAYCFINKEGIVYDLFPMYNDKWDYNITLKDKSQLLLNVCGQAINTCGNASNYATYVSNGSCLALTGNETKFSKWVVDTNSNRTILTASLPQGEPCQKNKSLNYSIKYEITCDEKINSAYNTSAFDIANCENTIRIRSKYGYSY